MLLSFKVHYALQVRLGSRFVKFASELVGVGLEVFVVEPLVVGLVDDVALFLGRDVDNVFRIWS